MGLQSLYTEYAPYSNGYTTHKKTKEEKIIEAKENLKFWEYRLKHSTHKYELDEPDYCRDSVNVCKKKLHALKEKE